MWTFCGRRTDERKSAQGGCRQRQNPSRPVNRPGRFRNRSIFADFHRTDAYAMVPPMTPSIPRIAAATDPAVRSTAANAHVTVPAIIAAPARSVPAMNESDAFGYFRAHRTGIDGRRICFSSEDGEQTKRLAIKGITPETLIGEMGPLVGLPAFQLALPVTWDTWRTARHCDTLGV